MARLPSTSTLAKHFSSACEPQRSRARRAASPLSFFASGGCEPAGQPGATKSASTTRLPTESQASLANSGLLILWKEAISGWHAAGGNWRHAWARRLPRGVGFAEAMRSSVRLGLRASSECARVAAEDPAGESIETTARNASFSLHLALAHASSSFHNTPARPPASSSAPASANSPTSKPTSAGSLARSSNRWTTKFAFLSWLSSSRCERRPPE
mmetsp:Transcript_33278/g.82910  ORF Transcript_33278/g.82910 Transcript_33278/m.82910 type:complete len:214 (-) Transcript_33278:279-920(-)